ncbi:MAG: hypothetical protein SGCHY_001149 [Lobulomycetales sp.]
MLNYADCGRSVMELSHRSKEYDQIHSAATDQLYTLLDIPRDDYAVLFLQGGATAHFAAVYLNLALYSEKPVDYCVSGIWSKKAAQEARDMGGSVNTIFSSSNGIPPRDQWSPFSPDPAYVFYVSNETVGGVEVDDNEMLDSFPAGVPVVCDMSSNILSRKIPVSRYGCIFAGAQKNIGPAGVTIVIIRRSLLRPESSAAQTNRLIPSALDYTKMATANSLLNTPPTYAIYISGLVFSDLLVNGGVEGAEARADVKSRAVYEAIQRRSRIYSCPVVKRFQSRMNIPFRVVNAEGAVDEALEAAFLKEAEARGMKGLKGHRSVGGIRASIYNAVPQESVDALVQLMNDFMKDQ